MKYNGSSWENATLNDLKLLIINDSGYGRFYFKDDQNREHGCGFGLSDDVISGTSTLDNVEHSERWDGGSEYHDNMTGDIAWSQLIGAAFSYLDKRGMQIFLW